MEFIYQLLAWLLMIGVISVLVIVHEFGHFLVARLFGFQTPVFGLGLPFGPCLHLGKKWDTDFRVYAFLLGGFVAIPELGDESSHPDQEEVFGMKLKPCRKFPVWQRMLVSFAGPAFNIIFAYLIMLIMLLSQGDATYRTVVHSLVENNPIAADAGIKAEDQILAIDGVEITSPEKAVSFLGTRKSQEVKVEIVREGKKETLSMTPSPEGKVGMVLVMKGPAVYKQIEGNILDVAGLAGVRLGEQTSGLMSALGMLGKGVWNSITTIGQAKPASSGDPQVGIQDVHGILAVLAIGSEIARQDWNQLFLFTILISIDLAIINLIPYPPLDGYHMASQTYELLRGRPMSQRVQGEFMRVGWVTIFILFAVIMVNDVSALVTGKLRVRSSDENQEQIEKKIDKKVKELIEENP